MSALWLPAGHAAGAPTSGPAARDQSVTLHLGKITVRGERQIVKALQIIKLGLRQPYSSDPKLANVVVCRMHDKVGSHVIQVLICGTNANLAKRRTAFQIATLGVIAQCGNNCGLQNYANGWNEVLADQPGQVLDTRVNGAALRALLAKVPLPAPKTAPAAAGKTGH